MSVSVLNNALRTVQFTIISIMSFPSKLCCLIFLRTKYFSQFYVVHTVHVLTLHIFKNQQNALIKVK